MDNCLSNAYGNDRREILQDRNVHLLLHADYAMLLAENPNDLQRMLDRQYDALGVLS